MFVSKFHVQCKKISFIALALTISLCAEARLCYSVCALPLIATKMHTPTEEKLRSNSVDESSTDFAPINLTGDKSSGGNSGSQGNSDKQYMKLHAESMSIPPKGPLEDDGSSNGSTTLPSKSLKVEIGKSKGGNIDQARRVNAMPMALMYTDAEMEGKALTDIDCERAQISELWESTLNRSPDIQFVVQKLMPSSDRSHTTNVLMRMISSMIATGVGTGSVIFGPNQAAIMGSQMTSNMIYQMMGAQEAKTNKHAQIDQAQAIMLYQMVRNIAEKVTETYRDYKFHVRRIDTAQVRALKLQNMVRDARAGQDATEQIEMEYWVDRAQADVEEAAYAARRYRQSLIDLAGIEAVCKLDQSFEDQFLAEKEIESKRKKEIAENRKSNVPDRTKEAITKLLNVVQPQTIGN